MINAEKEEEFDRSINISEYIASFMNPEGVQKVKEARENTKSVGSDEDFKELVREQFGRDLKEDEPTNLIPLTDEQPKAINKNNNIRRKRGRISLDDIEKLAKKINK